MIKLIASDIDGTLLEDGGHALNPELFDVILQLRKKGIQFAAASGRHWSSIEATFDPVKEKVFYISSNGAYVGCHGRNLFLNPIDTDLVMEMVDDIRAAGLIAMIEGQDHEYLDTDDGHFYDWMVHGYKFPIVMVDDIKKVDDRFVKISAYKPSGIEAATRHLVEKYKDRMHVTISGDMWMDCMASEVSKGWAVKLLQDSLEIKPEETMVFGDQLNDIEMIGCAYYSYAVGNARPEVKAAARFETDTNQNDGVLKVLKLLL